MPGHLIAFDDTVPAATASWGLGQYLLDFVIF
jgi:hypothetical protein